jgi:phosphatidate cytidylyltransferase
MARSELFKRVAVAAAGIPAAVVVLYLGGWVMGIGVAALAAGGAMEFYRLADKRGVRALRLVGAAGAAAYVLLATAFGPFGATSLMFWLTLGLLLVVTAAAIWRRGVEGQPLVAASVTLTGALYTGATLSCAMFLRHIPGRGSSDLAIAGTAVVLFPLAITWINDSAAYFVGRAVGKTKLIPKVSPGKTVEGAAAGVVAGILTGVLYALYVLEPVAHVSLGALYGALIGAAVAVAAQVGDLVESLFKREAGVKDSGTLLPGHGGILDRFDALYFSIPVAYALLQALNIVAVVAE